MLKAARSCIKSAPMSAQTSQVRARHMFAPLGKSKRPSGEMVLKGIVFDMDGTLCEAQNHMFQEMRSVVQIPKDTDILDFVHSLPPREEAEAFSKIQEIESRAMKQQVPQAGLVSLMEYLDSKGVKKGICTRNFDAPVNHLLENHIPTHVAPFSPIITRDFRPPKPSPAGILHIAHSWGVVESTDVPASPPAERLLPVVMVGDSVDDITAGYEAGALTVLLRSPDKEDLEQDERTDVSIGRLDELIELLETGLKSRRTSVRKS